MADTIDAEKERLGKELWDVKGIKDVKSIGRGVDDIRVSVKTEEAKRQVESVADDIGLQVKLLVRVSPGDVRPLSFQGEAEPS